MKTRSSKNNNNNNNNAGGDEQPQLRRSERKRKLNKLSNDGKPAAGEDQPGPEKEECSCKNSRRDGRNDQDLEIVQFPQPQVTGDGEKETADENEEQAEEEADLPIQQPMKIQLSRETWFEMLTFVGRRQLGQLVTEVGDRRFAGIVQPFLHNYGRITLANICISGPQHPLIQHALEIPENVNDFQFICLSNFNTPVINLLQKFNENSLFGNVNLDLLMHKAIRGKTSNILYRQWNRLLQTLSNILPTIDNINSIRCEKIAQLAALYNSNSESVMTMLKMARFLDINHEDANFAPYEITFLNNWLHTPRDDEKPRVLVLPEDYYRGPYTINKIPLMDDTIKSEFTKAKIPVCFFIRLFVDDTVQWHDSSMENVETKEKLVVKKVATSKPTNYQQMALISRYPLGAGKLWIVANEQEALDWNFDKQNGRICLVDPTRNTMANCSYGDRDRAFGDRCSYK